MKKNGFTMIELLAAIVILGVLSVIAITASSRLITRAKKQEDNQYEKSLLISAESYMQDNKAQLPKTIGERKVINAHTLKDKRYLKEDKGGCVNVYKKTKTEYSYEVDMDCKGRCTTNHKPTFKAYFTDDTLKELNNAEILSNIKRAKVYVRITGGVDSSKKLAISGYNYSIYASDSEHGEHEVYNSGSLNGNNKTEITITRPITDYVDITGLTNFKIKVEAINEYGCSASSGASQGYKDPIPPTCTNISNQAKEGEWINKTSSLARVITATCEDGNGSGCIRPTFTRTWPNDEQEAAEWAYIQISDNAGNVNLINSVVNPVDLCQATPVDILEDGSTNLCRVRVNVDKITPTIKLTGAYAANSNGGKSGANMYKQGSITIDDKTVGANGVIKVDQFNNLVNTWMNNEKYPHGVVFEIEMSDNLHMDTWSWKTNPPGLTTTNGAAYTNYSNRNEYVKKITSTSGTANCGKLTEKILVGFKDEGMRSGELTLRDAADNKVTLIISANLDRTAPAKPTVSYKKATSGSNYTPGTAVSNWSTETIKSFVSGAVGGDISGWDSFKYFYRKQNGKNNTEATTEATLAPAATGSTTKANPGNEIKNLAGYEIKDEGRHLFRYKSCDKAGNCSDYTGPDTIKIDTKPPACSAKTTYSQGATLSSGWLGKNETATVTQVCTEANVDYGSGCDYSSISHYNYLVDIDTNQAGAEGNGKGGSIKDKAGNVNNSCPANQTIRIDHTSPKCVTTGDSKTWKKTKTIKRSCTDPKDSATGKVSSGCTSSSTKSFKFAKKDATVSTKDKVYQTYKFPQYGIADIAGNTNTCPSETKDVFVDGRVPNCEGKKSKRYTEGGVTIKYTCDDLYGKLAGVGVKTCPKTQTGIKKTQKKKANDKLEHEMTCKVEVNSRKEYKKRTCKTCDSCKKAPCASWSTSCSYSVKTASTCYRKGNKHPVAPSFCGNHVNTDASMCCCTESSYCSSRKRSCSKCGCAKWSGYSKNWSTKNHCPHYKNSKTCQQKSRTVYY